MTIWKRYEVTNFKSEQPCITIRRSGFAINVSMMAAAKLETGDFVEIYVSDQEDMIGFKFFKEKQLGRLTITPDGGGKSRALDAKSPNGFVACSLVKNNDSLSKIVSTKNSKLFPVFEDDMWVIRLVSQWKYDASVRKPEASDMGIYRYLLDDDVVYIGRGWIQQRLSSPERTHWNFNKIEYTLMTEDESVQRESQLIRAHREAFGRLPFYNRNMPSIK